MPVFTRKILATGISLLAPLLTMVAIASSCTPNQEPTQPPEPPEQPPVESGLSLARTYTSPAITDGWSLMLELPEEATTEVLETVLNVKYIGPDAAPETEITDGFLIGFSLVSGETIDTYIEGEDIPADQVQQTTIAGFNAKTYQDESLIGDDQLEHYVFQLDEGNANQPSVVVDSVVLVKGEDREEYRRIVQAIIESMEWTKLE